MSNNNEKETITDENIFLLPATVGRQCDSGQAADSSSSDSDLAASL